MSSIVITPAKLQVERKKILNLEMEIGQWFKSEEFQFDQPQLMDQWLNS